MTQKNIAMDNMTPDELYKIYPGLKLMPFQWEPFNGDTHLETTVKELKEKHGIKTALELGTCLGSTAVFLASLFDAYFGCDVQIDYLEITKERLRNTNGVSVHEDSREFLDFILRLYTTEEPIFIFIDSHWGPNNPLLEELEIIAKSGHKPALLIHDFKVPGHPELGYDTYPDQNIVYEWDWIKEHIHAIYGENFTATYNSEATGAKRGVVIIEPLSEEGCRKLSNGVIEATDRIGMGKNWKKDR